MTGVFIGSRLMDVLRHGQFFVWYRACLETQHSIVGSCVHSRLMCEVDQNILEGRCMFCLQAVFHVIGTLIRWDMLTTWKSHSQRSWHMFDGLCFLLSHSATEYIVVDVRSRFFQWCTDNNCNALIRCRQTIVFEKGMWLSEVWVAIVLVTLDVQTLCKHIQVHVCVTSMRKESLVECTSINYIVDIVYTLSWNIEYFTHTIASHPGTQFCLLLMTTLQAD